MRTTSRRRSVARAASIVLALFAGSCSPPPAAHPEPAPDGGELSTVTIPGTASGFRARAAKVYLPPAYGREAERPLPVLFLLAGVPGSTDDWFDHGRVREELDAFAARHGGRAPVVVAPDDTGVDNEDLLCMDSPLGNVDQYLSQDVPAWVDEHLRVDPDSRTWAVGGFSYGGTCAYELAVRHPARFPTFLDFSGEKQPMHDTVQNAVDEVFHGDSAAYARQDPLAILRKTRFPHSAGTIAVGEDDEPYTAEQRAVYEACRNAGMNVRWLPLPGGHDWDVWTAAFAQSLDWLTARMGLAVQP
ncbi:alpha/beta hydrolase [Amycolatopsis anabasis]|uniref:alpha/beta hydrolase n=1 Tax=Amycolatopsis anabasis TaxID=1840409 RepID=UPI00131CF857|nr:alpha/beta hydrolase-fold protein [Amycolatopsis anabasis]